MTLPIAQFNPTNAASGLAFADQLSASGRIYRHLNDLVVLDTHGRPLTALHPGGRGRPDRPHLGHVLFYEGLITNPAAGDDPTENLRAAARVPAQLRTLDDFLLLPNIIDRFPRIDRILTAPSLYRTPGTRRVELLPAGYHAATRTLVAHLDGRSWVPAAHPEGTYPHLLNLFSGCLWATPNDLAIATALAVCAVGRPLWSSFPLVLIRSARKSSGKTTVARTLALLTQGADVSPITYPGEEQELEVRIAAAADPIGPVAILIDNFRPTRRAGYTIRSQFLSALASAGHAAARALYRGPVPLSCPTVYATMQWGRVERDLADKTLCLNLNLPDGEQHRRMNPHPYAFAVAHLNALRNEALEILRGLPPPDTAGASRFYDFEPDLLAIGASLGRPISLDAADAETADAFTLELLNLLRDDCGGSASVRTLIEKAATLSDSEVHATMQATGRTITGQITLLTDLIRNLPSRIRLPSGESVRLSLSTDTGRTLAVITTI